MQAQLSETQYSLFCAQLWLLEGAFLSLVSRIDGDGDRDAEWARHQWISNDKEEEGPTKET